MRRGKTHRIEMPCGVLRVTVNGGDELQTFLKLGKSGSCSLAWTEAISRLIGLAARKGASKEEIIEELIDLRCPSGAWHEGVFFQSCPDAVGQILRGE